MSSHLEGREAGAGLAGQLAAELAGLGGAVPLGLGALTGLQPVGQADGARALLHTWVVITRCRGVTIQLLTPWKQTNSWLHTVLFGLRLLGGHCTARPSQ